MKKKKQLKSENKTRIKVATSHADMSPAQLKKYGVCEHNQINYKTLDSLAKQQQKFIVGQMKKIEQLEDEKNAIREIWSVKYKTLNESHARWTEAYKNLEVDWEDCLKKNKDAIKKNKQLIKSHNEITRAYNGLHQLGKFAEQEGIDIRKHQKQLPEYEFHQKHTLLESGRVEHKYLLKKPKKETEDKK